MPVQVPWPALRVNVRCGVPAIVGPLVLAGGASFTIELGALAAVMDGVGVGGDHSHPYERVLVSDAERVRVVVAPSMSLQLEPSVERCHW